MPLHLLEVSYIALLCHFASPASGLKSSMNSLGKFNDGFRRSKAQVPDAHGSVPERSVNRNW